MTKIKENIKIREVENSQNLIDQKIEKESCQTTSTFFSKRKRCECSGCGNIFTCSEKENYDYCSKCEINGSRYVNKENKCSECGDGKGIIQFPHQPPRSCKLCFLARQE
jgi:hypothetical protein